MSISAHHGDPSVFLFYLLNIPLLSRGSNWSNGREEVSSRYWEQIGCVLDVMSISTTSSVSGWTQRNTRLYMIHAVRMGPGKPKRWSVFASYYPHILVLHTLELENNCQEQERGERTQTERNHTPHPEGTANRLKLIQPSVLLRNMLISII